MTVSADMPAPGSGFDLHGRVAVVTGGGRGLGRAIAGALAAHGAHCVIAGRTEATLAQAAGEIQTAGGRAEWIVADVSREDDVAALAAQAEQRFGPCDILVNNAGANPFFRRPEATPLAEWQEVIGVNLTGVFLCSRMFGAGMLARGSGSIISVTSIAGHVGLPRSAAYCAAKGGVELMTRSLAIEWAERGVRVNCIAPGYFETDLTGGMRANASISASTLARVPMRRYGRPDEVGAAAVFLAGPGSAFVTGQSIVVDGGWVAA